MAVALNSLSRFFLLPVFIVTPSKNQNRSISQESSIRQEANMQGSSPRFRSVQFCKCKIFGEMIYSKNIVRLNPSFTSVSCSDDKDITYPEVWCTCKVLVWLILMKKLLFVVGFTLLLPAPPSSPIDKFPFCIKQEQTQHFTLTC